MRTSKSGNDVLVLQPEGQDEVDQNNPESLVIKPHADYEKWRRLWPEENPSSDRILLYVDQFRFRDFDPNQIIF